MRSGFPGFPPEALAFFRGLARNNKREWFQPRKHIYDEQVKAPMVVLVAAVNEAMRTFAPDYTVDPQKAIYRIYRDTRFSKDKTPYKDHIAASFRWQGAGRHEGAGYYFAVSHKEVAVGGGMYMPHPEVLLTVRQHIAENHNEMRRLMASRQLRKLLGEMQGEQLSRVPKGFAATDAAADLLRYKQFFFYSELPPDVVTTPALFRTIVDRFRVLAPWMAFLNAPLKPAKAKRVPREDRLLI